MQGIQTAGTHLRLHEAALTSTGTSAPCPKDNMMPSPALTPQNQSLSPAEGARLGDPLAQDTGRGYRYETPTLRGLGWSGLSWALWEGAPLDADEDALKDRHSPCKGQVWV